MQTRDSEKVKFKENLVVVGEQIPREAESF